MRKNSKLTMTFIVSLFVTVLAGCSGGKLDKVTVSGEVRYNGKPLQHGQVRFVPVDGTSGPVSGGVITNGHYVAEGKGGVPLGEHRVEIRAYRPVKGSGAGLAGEQGGVSEQYLPGKYNGQSILTAVISRDSAASPINFDLDGS
jgi:hypothetical protein